MIDLAEFLEANCSYLTEQSPRCRPKRTSSHCSSGFVTRTGYRSSCRPRAALEVANNDDI